MNDFMDFIDTGNSVLLLRDINQVLELINNNPRFIKKLRETMDKLEEVKERLEKSDLKSEIDLILKAKEEFRSKLEFYLDRACENIELNHGECYYASNLREVLDLLNTFLNKDDKILISLAPEIRELDLPNHLRNLGYNIHFSKIAQLIGDIIGLKYPSKYSLELIDEDYILNKLNEFLGVKLRSLDDALDYLGEYVKKLYSDADVAITGADAVAADTGTIFIVDEEGDIRPLTGSPRVHIVIVGIDKVYPSYIDAWTATYIRYNLTYVRKPTNISIISSPSKTGDIEKMITYGAHGPEKLIVILLDNKRKITMLDDKTRSINNCLDCGACSEFMPILIGITGNLMFPVESLKELYYRIINDDPALKPENVRKVIFKIIKEGGIVNCPLRIDYKPILDVIAPKDLSLEEKTESLLNNLLEKLLKKMVDST